MMNLQEDLYTEAETRLAEYIRRNALRRTRERFEILQAVCAQKGFFTLDELGEAIRSAGSYPVSRVTLFNAMELFVAANLVVKHSLRRASVYECSLQRKPRILQVCDHCGEVSEFHDDLLSRQLGNIRARAFVVQYPMLYLHGLCNKCNRALRRRQKRLEAKLEQKKNC